jgi:hypothetical protein
LNLRPPGPQPQGAVRSSLVGLGGMGKDARRVGGSRMPAGAADAALETFASLARARHPGCRLLPLRRVGADGAVVAAPAGQVLWPFAAPQDPHAVLDRDAGVRAVDDDRVD